MDGPLAGSKSVTGILKRKSTAAIKEYCFVFG